MTHYSQYSNVASAQADMNATLKAKFLFLWNGAFVGDNLDNNLGTDVITVTGKDFITSYIPSTSTATFAVPDNATYKNADEDDDFWFDSSDVLQQKTVAELVALDNTRTFIRYDNASPYHVRAVGILKAGETLTVDEEDELSRYFFLYLLYFGAWNDYGYAKENR